MVNCAPYEWGFLCVSIEHLYTVYSLCACGPQRPSIFVFSPLFHCTLTRSRMETFRAGLWVPAAGRHTSLFGERICCRLTRPLVSRHLNLSEFKENMRDYLKLSLRKLTVGH